MARTLTDMHAFAAGVRAEGERLKKQDEFPRTVAEKLQFLGETNLKNTSAVERLMKMGRRHHHAVQLQQKAVGRRRDPDTVTAR